MPVEDAINTHAWTVYGQRQLAYAYTPPVPDQIPWVPYARTISLKALPSVERRWGALGDIAVPHSPSAAASSLERRGTRGERRRCHYTSLHSGSLGGLPLAPGFLAVASNMPIRVPATAAERMERGAVLMRGILRGWGISPDGRDDHQLNELGELILLTDPCDECDSP
ncbi:MULTISPECIES: hypothetical protein [unclassified Streptomyces]|uniref:hypothetical protein n=1 Tax=unclassified Streptomyces TaxID=2593676 RepID=UPI002E18467D|nr:MULTISPECIES: hypothetical protein [unclassified Streptomyces]